MKNNLLLLGVLLLFVVGIVLANVFWVDEIPQNTKVLELKHGIGDSNLESPAKKTEQKSHSLLSQTLESISINKNDNDESRGSEDSSAIQETLDKESKRLSAIERRKNKMAERKHYKMARYKWRKSLDKARAETKVSGDYSVYEAIKKQEPGKD